MSGESKKVAQLSEELRYRGETMRRSDVLTLISQLPDDVYLTTSEAAVFLRRSVSKMERLRIAGTGPVYIQDAPMPGSKATNLAVLYEKSSLKAWAKDNTAGSAMEHATLHGRTFATLHDVVEEHAFYIDAVGRVEGLVENFTIGEVVDGLGKRQIAWMAAVEGASRPWTSLSAHRAFAESIAETLSRSLRSIEQNIEATDIGESAAEGAKSIKLPGLR